MSRVFVRGSLVTSNPYVVPRWGVWVIRPSAPAVVWFVTNHSAARFPLTAEGLCEYAEKELLPYE
jgi:hypothetical protein